MTALSARAGVRDLSSRFSSSYQQAIKIDNYYETKFYHRTRATLSLSKEHLPTCTLVDADKSRQYIKLKGY